MAKTFLERLDDEARDLLLAVARPVSHAKGERLVRHGDPSRGAYVLRTGAAEATVTLPGGEKLTVARLEAGNVFGEMALVERGTCTATVHATEKLEGWFIERDDFRSLVAQRVPAALRVQHALTLALSDKVRQLNANVLAVPAAEDKPRRSRAERERDPLANVKRLKKASFDFKPFLPQLPFFESFDAAEIADILDVSPPARAAARPRRLPRRPALGRLLHRRARRRRNPRPARQARAPHGRPRPRPAPRLHERTRKGEPRLRRRRARGHAAAGNSRRDAFDKLYFGTSPASTKLHRVIQRSLLSSLGQTNRHLTRLISQARLRGAEKEGNELREGLQRPDHRRGAGRLGAGSQT